MGLSDLGWGQSTQEWDSQNDELEEGSQHEGEIFDFGCFDAKTGKTYAKFGVMINNLTCQRFYEVKSNTTWVLERDLGTILGRVPSHDEVMVDGRTGPVRNELIGKKVSVFYGDRDGWTDLYIDSVVGSEDGGIKYTGGGMQSTEELDKW